MGDKGLGVLSRDLGEDYPVASVCEVVSADVNL